jgi:hypothetical protein
VIATRCRRCTAWLAALAACSAAPADPSPAPVAPAAPPGGIIEVQAPVGTVPAVAVVAPTDADLQRVRQLLLQLAAEQRSSVVQFEGGVRSAKQDLQAMGATAVEALAALTAARDDALLEVGGTFFAILVRDLGAAARLGPRITDLLQQPAVQWRVFGCEAIGGLGWRNAVPQLQALLRDDTPVPGYAGDPRVAAFARRALDRLGER